MKTKIISTPVLKYVKPSGIAAVIGSMLKKIGQTKQSESEILAEKLATEQDESYPQEYYIRTKRLSKINLDETAKKEFINIMETNGFYVLGGVLVYLSNKIDDIVPAIEESSLLRPHKDYIMRTLVEGFPATIIEKFLSKTEVCVGVLRPGGKMIWANKKALEIIGMTLYQLIGTNIMAVTNPNYKFYQKAAQQLRGKFEPYFLEFIDKYGKGVQTFTKPVRVVNNMMGGFIYVLKDVFNDDFGKNIFADKNKELQEFNQAHQQFMLQIAKFQISYMNNQLTRTEIMLSMAKMFGGDKVFYINYKSNPKIILLEKPLNNNDEQTWLETNEFPQHSSFNELANYFVRNYWLHLSEKQSYEHKLLKDIPNYDQINSCFIVPVNYDKDGRPTGLFGLSSRNPQTNKIIAPDIAFTWLSIAAQWLEIISINHAKQ